MSFVDTRLHIDTTCVLEHTLPEVARVLLSTVFADTSEETAAEALRSLRPRRWRRNASKANGEDKDKALSSAGNNNDTDETDEAEEEASLQELHRECACVCTHLHEHVTRISHEWVAYLREVRGDARRIEDHARQRLQTAHAVRHRYHRSDTARVVDEAFREEVNATQRELDRQLEALRTRRAEPTNVRPAILDDACQRLKDRFLLLYRNVPTKRLARCRDHFEGQVSDIQSRVAEDFVRRSTELLSSE